MGHINSNNFNWNDNIAEDKQLFLEYAKERILNGNKMYQDLYINATFAFLAPDNYGVDSADDINISVDTQLKQAGKEFDKVVKQVKDRFVWACEETNNLELIDNTNGWRLRDFISEAWYQSEQYDKNNEHRQFAMWRRVVIAGLQILTDDMVCTVEHMSKYDKLN